MAINKARVPMIIFLLCILLFTQCHIHQPTERTAENPSERLRLRWAYSYENGPGLLRLPPTVVSDSMVVFSGAPMLEALSISNGSVVWQTPTHNNISLRSDHLLYNAEVLVSPQTDQVLAWDKATGDVVWGYLVPEEDVWSVGLYYNALHDNAFYLAGGRNIHKLRISDGHAVWTQSFAHNILAVLVQDSVLYASASRDDWRDDGAYEVGMLVALSVTTGDSLWGYHFTGTAPSYTAPILGDGATIYVGSNSASGKHTDLFRTYAIDARDGSLVWKTQDEVFTQHQILVGDTIFGNDGLGLYALDTHTGELLWQTDLEVGYGEMEVAYWDGFLYHQKGSLLHVVDASTGEIVVHKMLPPDNRTVFHVGTGSGSIFVQSTGHLYCYEPYQPGKE